MSRTDLRRPRSSSQSRRSPGTLSAPSPPRRPGSYLTRTTRSRRPGLGRAAGLAGAVARPVGVDGGCANDGGEDQVERGRELLAEGQLIGLVENPPVEDAEVRVEEDEGGTIGIDAAGDVTGSLSSAHRVGHELGC